MACKLVRFVGKWEGPGCPRGCGRSCPSWVLILVIAPKMLMSLGGISPTATVLALALLWGQAEAKGLVQLLPCLVLPPSVFLLSPPSNLEHIQFCLRLHLYKTWLKRGILAPSLSICLIRGPVLLSSFLPSMTSHLGHCKHLPSSSTCSRSVTLPTNLMHFM